MLPNRFPSRLKKYVMNAQFHHTSLSSSIHMLPLDKHSQLQSHLNNIPINKVSQLHLWYNTHSQKLAFLTCLYITRLLFLQLTPLCGSFAEEKLKQRPNQSGGKGSSGSGSSSSSSSGSSSGSSSSSSDGVLPAYCNPPNPCPLGYTGMSLRTFKG